MSKNKEIAERSDVLPLPKLFFLCVSVPQWLFLCVQKVLTIAFCLILTGSALEKAGGILMVTYVVDQNHAKATDDGPGTEEVPFKTISRAAEMAKPGDTVLVRAGIYRERVAPARGGEEGMPITYMAAPGEAPMYGIPNGNAYLIMKRCSLAGLIRPCSGTIIPTVWSWFTRDLRVRGLRLARCS